MKQFLRCFVCLLLLAPIAALAVNEKGDWPWNTKLHGWHDREVAEDFFGKAGREMKEFAEKVFE